MTIKCAVAQILPPEKAYRREPLLLQPNIGSYTKARRQQQQATAAPNMELMEPFSLNATI